jgi:hypothetical protein
VIGFTPLKILACIACGLHFLAVIMTSGVALCVGNDGHADYEWSGDACCGEEVVVVPVKKACCESCTEEPVPVVTAAPECGGCVDGLAPLDSGVPMDLGDVIPAPEVSGTVDLDVELAAGEIPVGGRTVTVRLPMPLPLRC